MDNFTFKRFFEFSLVTENPHNLQFLIEGKHDIITDPVLFDKIDIEFLRQFPESLWVNAMIYRYKKLYEKLWNYDSRIQPDYDDLSRQINLKIKNNEINPLGFSKLTIEDPEEKQQELHRKIKHVIENKGEIKTGDIPEMPDIPEMSSSEIDIESMKLAYETINDLEIDKFKKQLASYDTKKVQMELVGAKVADGKITVSSKGKMRVFASLYLSPLFSRLNDEYGFDLSHPSRDVKSGELYTSGLKFPSDTLIRQNISAFLMRNSHRLYGDLPEGNWKDLSRQTEEEKTDQNKINKNQARKKIKEMFRKENKPFSNLEVENELNRLINLFNSDDFSKQSPEEQEKIRGIIFAKPQGVFARQDTLTTFKAYQKIKKILKDNAGKDKVPNLSKENLTLELKKYIDMYNSPDFKNKPSEERKQIEDIVLGPPNNKGERKPISIDKQGNIKNPPIHLPHEEKTMTYINPETGAQQSVKVSVPHVLPAYHVQKIKEKLRKGEAEVPDNEKVGYEKDYQKVAKHVHGQNMLSGGINLNKDSSARNYMSRGDEEFEEAWDKVFGNQSKFAFNPEAAKAFINNENPQNLLNPKKKPKEGAVYTTTVDPTHISPLFLINQRIIVETPKNKSTKLYYKDLLVGILKCILSTKCGDAWKEKRLEGVDSIFIIYKKIYNTILKHLGNSKLYDTDDTSASNNRIMWSFNQASLIMQKALGGHASRRTQGKIQAAQEEIQKQGDEWTSSLSQQEKKGYESSDKKRGRKEQQSLQDRQDKMFSFDASKPEQHSNNLSNTKNVYGQYQQQTPSEPDSEPLQTSEEHGKYTKDYQEVLGGIVPYLMKVKQTKDKLNKLAMTSDKDNEDEKKILQAQLRQVTPTLFLNNVDSKEVDTVVKEKLKEKIQEFFNNIDKLDIEELKKQLMVEPDWGPTIKMRPAPLLKPNLANYTPTCQNGTGIDCLKSEIPESEGTTDNQKFLDSLLIRNYYVYANREKLEKSLLRLNNLHNEGQCSEDDFKERAWYLNYYISKKAK